MVEIWLKESSQPIFREGVKNVYEKGSYTCIQLEGSFDKRPMVEKYPTADVFRIVEPYEKVEPCEKVGTKDDTCRGTVPKMTTIRTGDTQVAIALVERKAGVKLSHKGREYVGILLQVTSNLNDIAKTVRDLAEYFEMTEG